MRWINELFLLTKCSIMKLSSKALYKCFSMNHSESKRINEFFQEQRLGLNFFTFFLIYQKLLYQYEQLYFYANRAC